MLLSEDRPQNLLRYGIPRTKEFLGEVSRLYDGLVVPGNILLYQYKSTPAIPYSLKKPFFIDPMSYLFAEPFERFKIKSKYKPSFVKLIEGHGISLDDLEESGYVRLTDLLMNSEDSLVSFTESCIRFQNDQVSKILNDAKEKWNLDQTTDLKPSFVIPPYFIINGPEKLELNEKIIRISLKEAKKINSADIFPMLFIPKDTLSQRDKLDDIISRFERYNTDGYCVWINAGREEQFNANEINGLIYAISELSNDHRRQVVILYGGFFTLSLYNYGVTAVCHGLAYSEARDINASVSQEGGPAPVRYYLPSFHQFVTIENALTVLRARPDLICDCPVCNFVIGGNPENVAKFQSKDEGDKYEKLSMLHFLTKRNQEKDFLASLENREITSYLKGILSKYGDLRNLTKVSGGDTILNFKAIENWSQSIAANP